MKILIPDAQFVGPPAFEQEAWPEAEFLVHRARDPAQIPDSVWASADAILAWQDIPIDRAVAKRLARCRIVVRHGVGYDRIDLEACAERNIPVCNVPDYGVEEVANHAIACALSLRRGLPTYTELLALDTTAGWRWDTPPLVRRLTGQALGIVGLGRIGRATAARAKAFGFDVGYFDPYLKPDAADSCLRFDDLGEMLAQADIVSLHCPLTRETHGLLGESNLARMKKGSILINTARGPIVDTGALLKLIEAGTIGGAALDVLPQEPPDPDDPLAAAYRVPPSWLAGRLILTPHAAFYSPESWYDLRHKAGLTVRDWLDKGILRNCVNAHLFPPGALPKGETTR